ncbi:MAG: hypothetical protein V1838_04965 [Patescibacteria group bacterium]
MLNRCVSILLLIALTIALTLIISCGKDEKKVVDSFNPNRVNVAKFFPMEEGMVWHYTITIPGRKPQMPQKIKWKNSFGGHESSYDNRPLSGYLKGKTEYRLSLAFGGKHESISDWNVVNILEDELSFFHPKRSRIMWQYNSCEIGQVELYPPGCELDPRILDELDEEYRCEFGITHFYIMCYSSDLDDLYLMSSTENKAVFRRLVKDGEIVQFLHYTPRGLTNLYHVENGDTTMTMKLVKMVI